MPTAGADTIVFDVTGLHPGLTSGGGDENAAASGDLYVTDSLTITGQWVGPTHHQHHYNNTLWLTVRFGVNQTRPTNNLTISYGNDDQNGVNNGDVWKLLGYWRCVDFF